MNTFWYSYIRYRFKEIFVWCAIPILSITFTQAQISVKEFVLFFIALVCTMTHVLLINDWGGLIRNPYEKGRYQEDVPLEKVQKSLLFTGVGLYILSFAVCLKFFGEAIPIILVIGIVSLLYSCPGIHLKEHLFGSKILHIIVGAALFLLGYLCFSDEWFRGTLISFFFSFIMLGGHFIHECLDVDEDRRKNLKTWATHYGLFLTSRTGLWFFVCGHFYWSLLFQWGMIQGWTYIVFLFPILIHLFFFFKLKDAGLSQATVTVYRNSYRFLYGLSMMICIAAYVIQQDF